MSSHARPSLGQTDMMRELPELTCPGCGIRLHGAGSVRAHDFDTCARKCEDCGIGFSNAQSQPTKIYRDPLANVPKQLRAGAAETIANAVNVRNRSSKWAKFGFETSEDALTWSVFSFLNSCPPAMLDAWSTLRGKAPPNPSSWAASVLLWGVPFPSSPNGLEVANQLIRISDALGEAPSSRSEPDVIIDGGEEGLIVIEVKYLSGNEVKTDHARFSEYLDERAFSDRTGAERSGLYELTRNWRIGFDLAGDRRLTLVNLGVKEHLLRRSGALEGFAGSLEQNQKRQFRLIDWREFLQGWRQHRPDWLERYLASRLSGLSP